MGVMTIFLFNPEILQTRSWENSEWPKLLFTYNTEKGTQHPWILNVAEKSFFIFWIGGHIRDLWPFCDWTLRRHKTKTFEISKMAMTHPFDLLTKSKGTLFSSILNVEENKLSLFFGLEVLYSNLWPFCN